MFLLLILKNGERLCNIDTENLEVFRVTCFWIANGKVQLSLIGVQNNAFKDPEKLSWPTYSLSLEDNITIKLSGDKSALFDNPTERSELSNKTTEERIKEIEIKLAKIVPIDNSIHLKAIDACTNMFFSCKKNNSLKTKLAMEDIVRLQLKIKWDKPVESWSFSITARYKGEKYMPPICEELAEGDQLLIVIKEKQEGIKPH